MQQRLAEILFVAIVVGYADYLVDVLFHISINDAGRLQRLGGMSCRVGKFCYTLHMNISLPLGSYSLDAYLVEPTGSDFLICLPGGGKTLGRERFKSWQESLREEGIGSLSFSFSGQAASPGDLSEQSLAKRIAEAVHTVQWIKEKYSQVRLHLCGISMGGYVALGAVHGLPEYFESITLIAPAAYSRNAHSLNFDTSFTEELHRPNSWQSSLSFDWLKEYRGRTLLAILGKDEIVPTAITDHYKFVGAANPSFRSIVILNSPHQVLNDDPENEIYKQEIFQVMWQTIREGRV
jgi:hypothetical protein